MSLKSVRFLFLVFVFYSQGLWAQQNLQYNNHTYDTNIRTVRLNPAGNNVQSSIAPPVTKVGQSNLMLSFDDLKEDADYYYVYFVHCNANWEPSNLRPNMFLKNYNEFEITDFEFSQEAKQQYVNYTFTIPAFEISGNYLAVVYRNRNKKDLVLSQRFYVYEENTAVGISVQRSTEQIHRVNNQRIEVSLNYAGLKAVDPREQFKIVVRQNQRPDLTRYELPPTFIDENAQFIRYQGLDEVFDFPGTNEFRAFDLSTTTFTGRRVDEIYMSNRRVVAQLRTDAPLADTYLQNLDINGQYYIRDVEGQPGGISAEYVYTNFRLKIPKSDEKIYVVGAFNNWQKNSASLMKYNEVEEAYEAEILLKQGWYNYSYIQEGANPFGIDGSFFETENLYEVFVYFSPMGGRGDRLVGYSQLGYNTRR